MWITSIPYDAPLFTEGGRPHFDDRGWLHRRSMSLFAQADNAARAELDVLFRWDPTATPPRLLVQSARKPVEVLGARSLPINDIVDLIVPDAVLKLSVDLNAVRTVNRTHNGSVKRTRERIPDGDLETWTAALLERHGFADADLVVTQRNKEMFTRGDGERTRRVPLDVVRINGTARVVDTDLARAAVRSGIGKGRSFGCGLLMVAA